MKNTIRWLGVLALAALIGFSFAACGDAESGGGGTTTAGSLNGVWRGNRGVDDHVVTISGSTGVFTQISSSAVWQDAINKGYIKAGDQKFRNLTKTGDWTWTGEERLVNFNSSTPNIATGVSWTNCTITLNANSIAFNTYTPDAEETNMTYTKTTLSLDGNWQGGRDVLDHVVTISGSTGVFTQISSSAVWQDAINKGYIKAGDQKFRNLTKTGDRTWTGEERLVNFNSSTPNIATGVSWTSCTITLNANSIAFNTYTPGAQDTNMTYTRR